MALIQQPLKSIKPQAGTLCQGVGQGSGSTLGNLFKMGTGGAQMFDYRGRADTASGSDARVLYARLHQYGAGGGEAVRAYAFAQNANTATAGTLNGLHATLSIATSSGISGSGNAIRATLEAASASRTLTGRLYAIQADANIGASNTMPTNHAYIGFTNSGSVALSNLFQIPAASNGTIFAAHTTQGLTHSIRIIDSGGTAYYIMCTNAATNRS
jgi:hypothetical protein